MDRRGFLAGVAGLLAGGVTSDPMSSNNRTQPIDSISQGDIISREYALARPLNGNPYQWETVNLEGADRVGLTLTHVNGGGTMVDNGECTIVDPEEGLVMYSYTKNETFNPAGDYHAQFHVTWSTGGEENLPPEGYDWFLNLGREQGGVPIHTPRIRAEEGVIDDLRTTDLETDTFKVNNWIAGLIEDTSANDHISRFDGAGLEVGPTGSLDMVDPLESGYVEGGPHSHLNDGEGSDQLYPRDLRVAGHPVFDVTHPDYGAEGDGTADDTQAIQSAINDAQAAGNGVVYLPPGLYYITDRLNITASVTIQGAGPTCSRFLPHFTVDENAGRVQNTLWVSSDTTVSEVELRDFGVDGSEAEDYYYSSDGPDPDTDYTEVIPGRFGHLSFRDAENVTIQNLGGVFCSNFIDMRGATGFEVHGLYLTESFNPIHMGGGCRNGTVTNIIGNRTSMLFDIGGGGYNISISNLAGECNAYKEEEAFDMGGATNVTVSNAAIEGYPVVAMVKGENGATWDDVKLSNITATNVTHKAMVLTIGSEQGDIMGDITVSGCTLKADLSEDANGNLVYPDVVGIETNRAIDSLTVSDGTVVEVTGPALNLDGANARILNSEFRSETDSAIIARSGVEVDGEYELRNTRAASGATPGTGTNAIDLAGAVSANTTRVEGCTVEEASGGHGIYVSNCRRPRVTGNDVVYTYNDGIHVRFSSTVPVDETRQVFDATISNNTIRDPGYQNTGRFGIYFTLALDLSSNRVYNYGEISHNEIRIRDNHDTNDHQGVRFNVGGNVTGLDFVSYVDNRMYDVSAATSGASFLGVNCKVDNPPVKTNV